MKKSSNKYRPESGGELMLVHECLECNALSINRIAADDDAESILTIFHESLLYGYRLLRRCAQQGIDMLAAEEAERVHEQLFGQSVNIFV